MACSPATLALAAETHRSAVAAPPLTHDLPCDATTQSGCGATLIPYASSDINVTLGAVDLEAAAAL